MAHILFINPSFFTPGEASRRNREFAHWIRGGNMYVYPFEPPLGLASLVAFLRTKGIASEILDLPSRPHTDEEVRELLKKNRPSFVGITTMSPTFDESIRLAGIVKTASPKTTVILGGVHPTVLPESALDSGDVDYAVIGEGEEALAELLHGHEPEKIPGIAYKRGDKYHCTGRAGLNIDLDQLPMPDYAAFPIKSYMEYNEELRGIRGISMLVSRGCPYGCKFCAVHETMGRHWRVRSPGTVIDDIRTLKERFGVEGIWFKDSIFNMKQPWVEEFCQLMTGDGPNIPWQCNTRVDLVNDTLMENMSSAGLVQIDIGIESGSPKSLEKMGKRISVDQIRQAVECAKKYVKVSGFFMIGIPGEKRDDIEQTFELAKELELDRYSWSVYIPLPGSPFYDDLIRSGSLDKQETSLWRSHFTEASCSFCELEVDELNKTYKEISNYFYSSHSAA